MTSATPSPFRSSEIVLCVSSKLAFPEISPAMVTILIVPLTTSLSSVSVIGTYVVGPTCTCTVDGVKAPVAASPTPTAVVQSSTEARPVARLICTLTSSSVASTSGWSASVAPRFSACTAIQRRASAVSAGASDATASVPFRISTPKSAGTSPHA